MWEQMDEAMTALNVEERPANSFTALEFFGRYKFPNTSGHRRLHKLIALGFVERRGIGNKVYYVWTRKS